MARSFITGDKEVERLLKNLSDKGADRVARNVLSAELRALVKAMKAAVPVGSTGNLKLSIGYRLERGAREDRQQAKAGIDVGKRSRKKALQRFQQLGRTSLAPHGHLVALGTKARRRKRIGGRFGYLTKPNAAQLSTGTMPANDFIKRATRAAMSAMRTAGRKALQRGLEREIARAKKG